MTVIWIVELILCLYCVERARASVMYIWLDDQNMVIFQVNKWYIPGDRCDQIKISIFYRVGSRNTESKTTTQRYAELVHNVHYGNTVPQILTYT